jgi:hypothetical protein
LKSPRMVWWLRSGAQKEIRKVRGGQLACLMDHVGKPVQSAPCKTGYPAGKRHGDPVLQICEIFRKGISTPAS